MANNIFNPTISEVNSTVTPQQAVVKPSSLGLFAEVASTAASHTLTVVGEKEMGDLQKKFGKISQARMQGGNSSALQAKARAALDEAKANSPWIAERADKLFKTTFGGGGGGVFAKTAEEKAQDAYVQKVKEMSLTLGTSEEEAAKRITMMENAKQSAAMAAQQKEVRQYNGEVVVSNTLMQIDAQSLNFQDAIRRGMEKGGGALKQEDKRSLLMTVDSTAARLRAELNANTRDDQNGHLLIGRAELEASHADIDAWVESTKQQINDQSMLKVIQDANTEQNAEITMFANKQFSVIKAINEAGGQAAVENVFQIVQRPEGPAKQMLINSNPVTKQMFREDGSLHESALSGATKIIMPSSGNPDDLFMTQPEAIALGTVINDPANAQVAQVIIDKVSSAVGDAQVFFKKMLNHNPDSAAIVWSDRYKSWKAANPDKGERFEDTVLDGLRKSFLSTYVADNDKLPTGFTIGSVKDDTAKARTSRKGSATKHNQVIGEGFTKESTASLRNILATFSYNKDALEKVRAESGIADLTPQEAVPYFVLGQVPERAIEAPADAVEVEVDPKKKHMEDPKKKVDLNETGENFVKKAVEMGWTEDDVTVFINEMGFSDNAQTEILRKKLSEAVGMKKKELEEPKKKGE